MKRLFLFVFLLGVLTACASEPVHLAAVELDRGGWTRDNPLELAYDNRDTLAGKTLVLIVRHTKDYSYDRLNLELTTFRPDGRAWTDTLSVVVKEGEDWKGERLVSFVNREDTLREGFRFGQAGAYRFRIRHLMPEARLKEVSLVGLSVR